MQKIISYYLGQEGYLRMLTSVPEFTIYFKKENGFVSMVVLADQIENPYLTKDAIDTIRQRARWKFVDQGMTEIHSLVLLIGDSEATIQNLSIADPFFWGVSTQDKKLIIPEGKVEDFYGLKANIETWIASDIAIDQERFKKEEKYSVSGAKIRGFWQQPLVNHAVFIVNVFLFTFCTLSGELLYNYGRLTYVDVMNGQWYRMITCMFLHGGMAHLVSNMFMLFFMGNVVEKEMGHIPYLFLYFGSGLLGSCASLYMQFRQIANGIDAPGSIGASGAIFGIMGGFLWVLLLNRGRASNISFFRVLFLIAFSLYGGLQSTNVDNAAHFGGLVAGFILAIFLYRRPKKQN